MNTTMKRFRVEYCDGNDESAPTFTTVWRRHSLEDLIDRFYESNDGDTWEIVSVKELTNDE